jgi:8-oxo-dGTP pyrophosphatase MutT (NUDIX family)
MLDDKTPSTFPKSLPGIYPHFTVSALPIDTDTREVALLYRGEGVRSAKNCLAIPSGLLEHGESFSAGIKRELTEELNLRDEDTGELSFQTIYRNMPGDGFDWVIGIWTIEVDNLRKHVKNMEPHKHDFVEILHFDDFQSLLNDHGSSRLRGYTWAGGLKEALLETFKSW